MLNQLFDLKKKLQTNNLKGLAVDIDETLSFTLKIWFKEMSEAFGNPEKLSIPELIAKYRYFQNVPYWQGKEMWDHAVKLTYDNELQTKIEVLGEADKYLPELHKQIPVLVYVTSRPVEVIPGTKIWLKKHGFPEAEIIARPNFVMHANQHQWKADVLEFLSPNIIGLIDDNYELLKHLDPKYQGDLFIFALSQLPKDFPIASKDFKLHFCPKWSDVSHEVLTNFKYKL